MWVYGPIFDRWTCRVPYLGFLVHNESVAPSEGLSSSLFFRSLGVQLETARFVCPAGSTTATRNTRHHNRRGRALGPAKHRVIVGSASAAPYEALVTGHPPRKRSEATGRPEREQTIPYHDPRGAKDVREPSQRADGRRADRTPAPLRWGHVSYGKTPLLTDRIAESARRKPAEVPRLRCRGPRSGKSSDSGRPVDWSGERGHLISRTDHRSVLRAPLEGQGAVPLVRSPWTVACLGSAAR